jgi:hypothetical protein
LLISSFFTVANPTNLSASATICSTHSFIVVGFDFFDDDDDDLTVDVDVEAEEDLRFFEFVALAELDGIGKSFLNFHILK